MPPKLNSCFHEVQECASDRHPPPLIDEFAADLTALVEACPANDTEAKLRALIRHREELSPAVRRLLVRALRALAERATKYATELGEDFDAFASMKTVEPLEHSSRGAAWASRRNGAAPEREAIREDHQR
jgi:hypothetical protein